MKQDSTKYYQQLKKILNSSFTLSILAYVRLGFRPSKIAKMLKVTDQRLQYHTRAYLGLVISKRRVIGKVLNGSLLQKEKHF